MIPRVLEPQAMETPAEAQSYAAMDHSEPNRNFVERLVDLDAGGLMLDIGTGPGDIPLRVCERIAGARVTGVDLSAAMLAIARARARASPHAARLGYVLADATGLPFADASLDAVFSNTILHHIPDPVPFLKEAWRVLKPRGVLLIRDLFRPASQARVEELVALHTPGADATQKQLFRQSLQAAFTPQELRVLVARLHLPGAEVMVDTDRHVSIQRRRAEGCGMEDGGCPM